MFPISNVSYKHQRIVGEIFAGLHVRLKQGSCRALNSPLRVRVSEKHYVCPDVTVVCEDPVFTDDKVDTVTNPKVIIEVLSPSTAGYDHGGNRVLYQDLPSLEEYVILAQDALFAEVIRRTGPKQWSMTAYEGPDAILEIPSIGVSIPLAEIYV